MANDKFRTKTKSGNDFASEATLRESERQKKEKPYATSKNVGEYDEAPGGGTPAAGGGRGAMNKNFVVAESPDDPAAKAAKAKGQAVRYNQPRTDDGQFTYNAANKKGLSTEKSRGHTDVPWLAGVDLTFIEEGATFRVDDPEMEVGISAISLTPSELLEASKIYLTDERGFAGLVGTMVAKKGRHSAEEKAAPEGKVGKVDTSTLSENTQKALDKAKTEAPKIDFTYTPTRRRASRLDKIMAKDDTKAKEPVGVGAPAPAPTPTPSMPAAREEEKPAPMPEARIAPAAGDFDASLASSDPEEFVIKHSEDIKQIMDLFGEDSGATPSDVVDLIASGEIKSVEHAKQLANEFDDDEEEENPEDSERERKIKESMGL